MRLVRNAIQFMIAFCLAFTVYALPLFSMLLSALMPDPVDLVVEQAPDREVSLVDGGALLDSAFLQPDPTQKEDPNAKEDPTEAPPPPAPPPPKPPPPPTDAPATQPSPPQQAQVDALAKEIADARRQQAKQRAEDLAKQRAEIRAAAADARGAAAAKRGGNRQKCADPTPGVAQLNPREFSIPRDVILHYASDLDAASHLAWVAWAHNPKGKVDGFSVRRIRCGSLLDQAGLKNGDVIHEVNGKAVNSIIEAFGAWRKVRKKDVVRILVTRSDEKFEIKYHIE